MDIAQLIEKLRRLELDPTVINPMIARLQTEGLTPELQAQLQDILAGEQAASAAMLEVLKAANDVDQKIEANATAQVNAVYDALEQEVDAAQAAVAATQARGDSGQMAEELIQAAAPSPVEAPVSPTVNTMTHPPAPVVNLSAGAEVAPSAPQVPPAVDASAPASTDWLSLLKKLESEEPVPATPQQVTGEPITTPAVSAVSPAAVPGQTAGAIGEPVSTPVAAGTSLATPSAPSQQSQPMPTNPVVPQVSPQPGPAPLSQIPSAGQPIPVTTPNTPPAASATAAPSQPVSPQNTA